MATKKKIKKALFKAGISRLIDWLGNKGWDTDFDYSVRDELHPDTKQVSINTHQGVEKQLYSLLHECGHLLIQQNWNTYEKDYPTAARMNAYATINRQIERSKKYKVDTLAEEIEAWKRGKTLADRLGVYVDEEKYNALRAECVYSYVAWAAK